MTLSTSSPCKIHPAQIPLGFTHRHAWQKLWAAHKYYNSEIKCCGTNQTPKREKKKKITAVAEKNPTCKKRWRTLQNKPNKNGQHKTMQNKITVETRRPSNPKHTIYAFAVIFGRPNSSTSWLEAGYNQAHTRSDVHRHAAYLSPLDTRTFVGHTAALLVEKNTTNVHQTIILLYQSWHMQ